MARLMPGTERSGSLQFTSLEPQTPPQTFKTSLSVVLDCLCSSPSCPASLLGAHGRVCVEATSSPVLAGRPLLLEVLGRLRVTDEDRNSSWPRETPEGQLNCCMRAEPGVYSALILLSCGESAADASATQECGYAQCRSKKRERK